MASTNLEVSVRLLPHDALGGTGDDKGPRKARYTNTLVQYKKTFGDDAPLNLWSDYSNDPVAVQAELEAQQAQSASAVRPHHHQSVSPTAAASPETDSLCEEPVVLNVRYQNGDETIFRIKMSTPMIKVMERFASRMGVSVDDLRFTIDGTRLLK
eukprot:gene11968-13882_t